MIAGGVTAILADLRPPSERHMQPTRRSAAQCGLNGEPERDGRTGAPQARLVHSCRVTAWNTSA